MNDKKLSSEEVPEKFANWLLSMGCPAEKIPSMDKVTLMCRGQYYMVWRSIMEHVEPKDVIRQKRMQVFCNDMLRCKKAKSLNERVLVPKELTAWEDDKEVSRKVAEAEERVAEAKKILHQAMDKLSGKLSQRKLHHGKVECSQRRVFFLQTLAEELQVKKGNLEETRAIVDSLCQLTDSGDVQSKVDKCISALSRQTGGMSPPGQGSGDTLLPDDKEDTLASIVQCPANVLWSQLYERRAALVKQLSAEKTDPVQVAIVTPSSILAHSGALHSSLCVETVKNRVQARQTRTRLANAIAGLSEILAGPACELAVLRLERASAEARVGTLTSLLSELTGRGGVFRVKAAECEGQEPVTVQQCVAIDRDIMRKKEEIKGLVSSLAQTERKIGKVRESLLLVFSALQRDAGTAHDATGSVQFEGTSASSLHLLYQRMREANSTRANLSMDLDTTDNSFSDTRDNVKPTLVDELKIYLKKFNLENNRKLVLESGEKIWIFETLQASADRLRTKWLSDDVTCSLLSPSVSLTVNIERLIDGVRAKVEMGEFAQTLENESRNFSTGFASELDKDEEERQIDKIKKRVNDNIQNLHKMKKTLDLGQNNLKLWSDNPWSKYVSANRTVLGKTYKEYEVIYLGNLNPVA